MSEMKRVFWAHTVASVGSSLVSIFVPIFLLKSGYSFPAVVTFLMFQNLSGAIFQYPAAKVVGRIGANRGMAVGCFVAAIYLASLLTLPHFHWPLVLVATLWGIDRDFYWFSLHANFSKARAHKKTGTQVSALNSIITFAHGLTPAIGGIIATTAGIAWSYALAITLIITGSIPLITGPEVTKRRPVSWKNLDIKRLWRDPASNFFNGMTTTSEMVLWPLIIYFIVNSYAGVGILSSIVIFASISVALYVGKREAIKGERHYLRRGLALETLTNTLRVIAQNAGHIFGINLINGVSRSLYTTPYMTRYYRHADEEPRLEYIALMETGNQIGGVFVLGIMLILSFHLSIEQTLLAGVVIAIPASFGTRLIR
jgi:hypothetical protein